MDDFRDDYKGHMIFVQASGPESGPWVGIYSIWALDRDSELNCVLHGSADGSYETKKFASAVAENCARQRIDALLVQDSDRAAGKPLHTSLAVRGFTCDSFNCWASAEST
jgi:hypothetical protein